MKSKTTLTILWTFLLALAAGCDPTPYDLTVRVTDQDGNAISKVVMILSDSTDLQAADEAGQVTWTDLENETVTLLITAPGYRSSTVEVTLERGGNEQVVTLEREVAPPEQHGG